MNDHTTPGARTAPALVSRRRADLRRRYKVVSVGLMAVLMAVLGVGFAADAGTTTVSVSTPAGVSVYPVSSGGAAPTGAVTLKYSSNTVSSNTTWASVDVPTWAVAAGSPGTLSTDDAGDVAYVDATDTTTQKLQISVYVTNLAALSVNYTSWAFSVGVYQSANGTTGWTAVTPQFVTSDSGAVSFIVDVTTMEHVGITLEPGGSFYTVDTDTTNGALAPTFFIRVQQL